MDALTALRLQLEWGADEALQDAPVDRLRPAAAAPMPAPRAALRAPPPAAPDAARGTPAERATQAAAAAGTLEELRAAIAAFDGSALRNTATNLVFAAGNAASGLLFVAEAPNADADRSGDPFSGRTGAYLEQMLRDVGIDRGGLLLAPLVPWRPPGDRPPSPLEIATFIPFLYRLIVLIAPRRMVLLGPQPARTLLGATPRRGTAPAWRQAAIPGTHMSPGSLPTAIDALAMPGPATLLQNASQRREAWAALRLLRRTLTQDVTSN